MDVHVLQLVVVGHPLDHVPVGVFVAGPGVGAALGRDQAGVDLGIWTIRCLGSP